MVKKEQIRLFFRHHYKKPYNSEELDNIIINNICTIVERGSKIGSFRGIYNEVNIDELFSRKLYQLYFPKTTDYIKFIIAPSINDFKKGQFGVLEPIGMNAIDINDLNYIIVPGVTFNVFGYRIGYGKGFYDKCLANYQGIKIGCCYDDCIIEEHFEESFDIIFDYLVSEKRIIKIKN